MAVRKYERYQVIGDGSDTMEFENYREAVSEYASQDAPKTLWGVSDMGEFTVIFLQE